MSCELWQVLFFEINNLPTLSTLRRLGQGLMFLNEAQKDLYFKEAYTTEPLCGVL